MYFINICMLCFGKKYSYFLYLNLKLLNTFARRLMNKAIINIFITHDEDLALDVKKFQELNIYLNPIKKPKNLNRPQEFPFFLKKDAIQYAASKIINLKEKTAGIYKIYNINKKIKKDIFLFLDVDVLPSKSFEEMLIKIADEYPKGIYGRFNWGTFYHYKHKKYLFTKFRQLNQKFNTQFNNINVNNNSCFLNKEPYITLYFFESVLIFNIEMGEILKFCKTWENIIDFIKSEKDIEYRTECIDIAIAAFFNNINVKPMPGRFKNVKPYFQYIDKPNFSKDVFASCYMPRIKFKKYHKYSSCLK